MSRRHRKKFTFMCNFVSRREKCFSVMTDSIGQSKPDQTWSMLLPGLIVISLIENSFPGSCASADYNSSTLISHSVHLDCSDSHATARSQTQASQPVN